MKKTLIALGSACSVIALAAPAGADEVSAVMDSASISVREVPGGAELTLSPVGLEGCFFTLLITGTVDQILESGLEEPNFNIPEGQIGHVKIMPMKIAANPAIRDEPYWNDASDEYAGDIFEPHVVTMPLPEGDYYVGAQCDSFDPMAPSSPVVHIKEFTVGQTDVVDPPAPPAQNDGFLGRLLEMLGNIFGS